MSDAGIDYGLGQTNIDTLTGIRYGVISCHSISGDTLNDLEPIYAGPNCPECGTDAILGDDASEEWPLSGSGCREYACEECQIVFDSANAYSEQAISLEYEDDDYSLQDCLDSDLIVIRSPYYTLAPYCSPCVPGAGNLDAADTHGVRTYALGHEWFDGNRAPYPLWRVTDDRPVIAEES